MSIFATNYTVDENTGEVKLIKHLNKIRVDRSGWMRRRKGWNKSGKATRQKKEAGFYKIDNLWKRELETL